MKNIPLIVSLIICIAGCKKFLDEKPDKKLVIPSTLADLQALLDHTNTMVLNEPYGGELSSDNLYLLTSTWQSLPDYDRAMFTWQKDNIYEPTTNDWSNLYRKIYVANTVLEALEKIDRNTGNTSEWNNIRGQALMIRGRCHMQALFLWSPAYDSATAGADMGIPLRLNTDLAETSVRPSVQQVCNQVISDLKQAAPLLPARGIHTVRASRVAAFGLLARLYLSMKDYAAVKRYADSSLQLNSALLNYNSITSTGTYPVPQFNPEISYYITFSNLAFVPGYGRADSSLYLSYTANDCRKTIFFIANPDGSFSFRGSYTGASGCFAGLATDELYLMRAEALARLNETTAALADLNALLQMRMKTGTFISVTAASPQEALAKILVERRKELLFRGIRWMDIKRLNKEAASITQKRILNNSTYTLLPNALGYALPIPEYVIMQSGMPQNPR